MFTASDVEIGTKERNGGYVWWASVKGYAHKSGWARTEADAEREARAYVQEVADEANMASLLGIAMEGLCPECGSEYWNGETCPYCGYPSNVTRRLVLNKEAKREVMRSALNKIAGRAVDNLVDVMEEAVEGYEPKSFDELSRVFWEEWSEVDDSNLISSGDIFDALIEVDERMAMEASEAVGSAVLDRLTGKLGF